MTSLLLAAALNWLVSRWTALMQPLEAGLVSPKPLSSTDARRHSASLRTARSTLQRSSSRSSVDRPRRPRTPSLPGSQNLLEGAATEVTARSRSPDVQLQHPHSHHAMLQGSGSSPDVGTVLPVSTAGGQTGGLTERGAFFRRTGSVSDDMQHALQPPGKAQMAGVATGGKAAVASALHAIAQWNRRCACSHLGMGRDRTHEKGQAPHR